MSFEALRQNLRPHPVGAGLGVWRAGLIKDSLSCRIEGFSDQCLGLGCWLLWPVQSIRLGDFRQSAKWSQERPLAIDDSDGLLQPNSDGQPW